MKNEIQFRIAKFDEINGGLFDRYSLVHMFFGILAEQRGLSYEKGLICHLLFEASENTIKMYTPELLNNYTFDSFANTMSDNVFFMLGMYISKHYINKL